MASGLAVCAHSSQISPKARHTDELSFLGSNKWDSNHVIIGGWDKVTTYVRASPSGAVARNHYLLPSSPPKSYMF